jgi:periplasmic protein TonB
MQLRQPSPDALVSFSDFLLERFGLVASMQVAIVGSIAFHTLVIMGLGMKIISVPKWDAPHNVLDVVLVNSKSATRPDKADALAQANLDGGGNTDEKLRASTPLPALDQQREISQELRALEARRRALESEAKELLTRMKSKAAVAQVETAPPGVARQEPEARDLVERSMEIARLEAAIRQQHQAYQERPKKKFVGARVQESRVAFYVDNWRQKIERIGSLNYPAQARTPKFYGVLRITVGIKANGDVESVEINRSSGHKFLDQAALRIVNLAAPFDRFPDNLRVDTDILYITRTWTFSRGDATLGIE